MTVTILCVGKIKEKFYAQAVEEYRKRLGRYCKLNVIEVADEKTPDHAPPAVEAQIKEKEGKRLLKYLTETVGYKVVLAIDGVMMDSPELAGHMQKQMVQGCNEFVFVIGGSLGLSEEVCRCADLTLSFSKLTFPHPLMRVILLEQIYRSYRIMYQEPYHK